MTPTPTTAAPEPTFSRSLEISQALRLAASDYAEEWQAADPSSLGWVRCYVPSTHPDDSNSRYGRYFRRSHAFDLRVNAQFSGQLDCVWRVSVSYPS